MNDRPNNTLAARGYSLVGTCDTMKEAEAVAATWRKDGRGTCIFSPQGEGARFAVWAGQPKGGAA